MLRRTLALSFALLAAACSLDLSTDEKAGVSTVGAVSGLAAKIVAGPLPAVQLNWQFEDGAPAPDVYEVYRAESQDALAGLRLAKPVYRKVAASLSPLATTGGTSFVDAQVEGGKTYAYRVRASRDGRAGPPSDIVVVQVTADGSTPGTPNPPGGGGPGDPTPVVYGGVNGPLPAAACGLDGQFSFASLTPANTSPLASPATYTVTAVVSYSVTAGDSVGLQIWDPSGSVLYYATPATQYVSLAPGCGQVTLSIPNVQTAGRTGFALQIDSINQGAVWETWTNYRLQGQPAFWVTALSDPLSSPLTLETDGSIDVTVDAAWNLQGLGYTTQFDAWGDFGSLTTQYPAVTTGAGAGTYEFQFWPQSCADTYFTVQFALYPTGAGTDLYSLLHWYVTLPSVFAVINPTPYVRWPDAAANFDVTSDLFNCTDTTQVASVASASPWLYPQAGTITVPAMSSVSVTYTVNPSLWQLGRNSAALQVHSPAQTFTYAVANFVRPDDSAFATTTATAAWDTAADAGTLVYSGNLDDAWKSLSLPFPVTYYGQTFNAVNVSTNGFVNFGTRSGSFCCSVSLPNENLPYQIALNWRDLYLSTTYAAAIRSATAGSAPNRRFVISYRNVGLYSSGGSPSSFQVIFFEDSRDILVQYGTLNYTGTAGANLGDGLAANKWTPASNTAIWIVPQ